MANPYTGSLTRGAKSYPNGTNVPKSGPSNSRGPATGPRNNRPTPMSTSTAATSKTYQPFVGAVGARGASGVLSSSPTDANLGKMNTPVKTALANRLGKPRQGPSKMLGGSASNVRPVG